MSDITAAPAAATSAIKLPGLGDIGAFMKRGDIALAIGVLTILVVLILPLPPLLLDLSLAISIILSVLILMTALFIHTPLEFSSFPTVLLIATMLRLALNLASTRLILSRGHENPPWVLRPNRPFSISWSKILGGVNCSLFSLFFRYS